MSTKGSFALVLGPAALTVLAAAAMTLASPDASAVASVTVMPAARVAAPGQQAAVRLVVSSSGNEARYRIRELLAGMELPYDAVGTTSAITGAIVLDSRGRVVPAQSKIVVDVTGLTSDKERRDGFVQRRLLETEQHPTVVLTPTAIRGLPWPLPTAGSRTFEMVGDLTVKGVTRPTTWRMTANFQGPRVSGSAATRFTFADFSLTQPKVPVVLSLADTIALEYDFNLTREGTGSR